MSNDSGLNVPHKTSLVHIPRQLIEMWADCRLSCTCVQSNIWKSCLEYKDDLTEGFCWDRLRVLSTEHTFFVFTNRGIYTHQTKCYQIQKSLLTSVHPVLFGVMFMTSDDNCWWSVIYKYHHRFSLCWSQSDIQTLQLLFREETWTNSSLFSQECVCVYVCMYLQSMSKDPQSRPGSSSTGNIQLRSIFIGQISNLSKTGRDVWASKEMHCFYYSSTAPTCLGGPGVWTSAGRQTDRHTHTLTWQDMMGDKFSCSSTSTRFLRGRGWKKKVSPSSSGIAEENSGSSSSSPRWAIW